MFIGAESRDGRRHELVIQGPLQQRGLKKAGSSLGSLASGLTVPPAWVFMATIPIPLFAARSMVFNIS